MSLRKDDYRRSPEYRAHFDGITAKHEKEFRAAIQAELRRFQREMFQSATALFAEVLGVVGVIQYGNEETRQAHLTNWRRRWEEITGIEVGE